MVPYIGITGFMSVEEVKRVTEVIPPNPQRNLMVGVLARRFPQNIRDIPNIFSNHPYVTNFIHYSTDDPDSLSGQLIDLVGIAGGNLNGFQLNVTWPLKSELERFREEKGISDLRFDMFFLVLQVGAHALRIVDESPTKLAQRVASYGDLIDAVLIDPSGGKGLPFVPTIAIEYLRAVRDECPSLSLGVAGGLCAETLGLVETLLPKFPDLSIDAEGLLRNPSDDSLNLYLATKYFSEAMAIFA